MNQRQLRLGALAAADAAVLAGASPQAFALPARLQHADSWLVTVGADQAAISVAISALWLVAAWVGLAVMAALAASAPGLLGVAGNVVVRRTVPAALRMALLGSVGLTVVGASGMAQATAPPPAASTAQLSAAQHAQVQLQGVDWPTSAVVGQAPHVDWPSTPTPPSTQPARPHAHAVPVHKTSESVTVSAGDSLWLIAAHRLGPHASDAQIAASWPQWYATNRTVVGDNPAYITPGERLLAPAHTAGTPPEKGASK